MELNSKWILEDDRIVIGKCINHKDLSKYETYEQQNRQYFHEGHGHIKLRISIIG